MESIVSPQTETTGEAKNENILLIINPVSGKMKSKTGLFEILDELYRLPDGSPDTRRLVTVCPTMFRGQATALAASARDRGFDRVICCGGDGTLNETVNGLMTIPGEVRPPLGYIAAGSTNDFATSIGLPSNLRALARIAGGEGDMPLDVGQFLPLDDGFSQDSRFFSYIATFGVFSEASYATPQNVKNVLGHMAYILSGINELGNIQPYRVSVELADGTTTEGEYIFGAVTNTISAGGVVKLPADQVSLSDGALEVFLIRRPRNPGDLNRIISSLLASNYEDNPMIQFYHTPRARFTMEEPLCWSLDGEEARGGTRVEIVCHAGAIHLVHDSQRDKGENNT